MTMPITNRTCVSRGRDLHVRSLQILLTCISVSFWERLLATDEKSASKLAILMKDYSIGFIQGAPFNFNLFHEATAGMSWSSRIPQGSRRLMTLNVT